MAAVPAAALALAVACATLGAGGAAASRPVRPEAGLTVWPARLALAGGARRTIHLINRGRSRVVVDAAAAGLALDLRGRPRIVRRRAGAPAWVAVSPRRAAVPAGGATAFVVAATPLRRARPGDHDALVLLTTEPRPSAGVPVRVRIGVVAVVRVPGAVARRLDVAALTVRRDGRARVLGLTLANRGDVVERVPVRRLLARLVTRGRVRATLRAGPRELLPRSRAIVELRYAGPLRGRVGVRVVLLEPRPGEARLEKRFEVRL